MGVPSQRNVSAKLCRALTGVCKLTSPFVTSEAAVVAVGRNETGNVGPIQVGYVIITMEPTARTATIHTTQQVNTMVRPVQWVYDYTSHTNRHGLKPLACTDIHYVCSIASFGKSTGFHIRIIQMKKNAMPGHMTCLLYIIVITLSDS
ncbi:hypothetical protein Btru_057005 [Bulinus truncatus]|nr:hypothetical protein Btru_057005 [Bulinus truncatus]